jgi:hypothetical protein
METRQTRKYSDLLRKSLVNLRRYGGIRMLGNLLKSVVNIAVNATEVVLMPVSVLVSVTDDAVSEIAKDVKEVFR